MYTWFDNIDTSIKVQKRFETCDMEDFEKSINNKGALIQVIKMLQGVTRMIKNIPGISVYRFPNTVSGPVFSALFLLYQVHDTHCYYPV